MSDVLPGVLLPQVQPGRHTGCRRPAQNHGKSWTDQQQLGPKLIRWSGVLLRNCLVMMYAAVDGQHCTDVNEMLTSLPADAVLVGVEKGGVPLRSFKHPLVSLQHRIVGLR